MNTKIFLITFSLILILSIVAGCSLQAITPPPEEHGNKITLDGVTFTYKPLKIRNWKERTDEFFLTDDGCLMMKGKSWVDNTFHESNFMVFTDLDICEYRWIKLNSTIESITQRVSISPSSQVLINGYKFSSHSMDNDTLELYSTNLRFYNDRTRFTAVDDELHTFSNMCNNLTIQVLDSGGENGTAVSSLKICPPIERRLR